MHSTPNYGYSCHAAVDRTGCDIECLKDKTDNHSERITRSEERIKCLSGRIHHLECAPCGKPDSCRKALRRHLADPDAHEGLFDQKVDKKDGCRLICEEEVAQVQDALSKKANKGNLLIWHPLPLSEGYIPYNEDNTPQYAKDQFGCIYLRGTVRGNDTPTPVIVGKKFARLPDGFYYPGYCNAWLQNGSSPVYSDPVNIAILQDGTLLVMPLSIAKDLDSGALVLDGIVIPPR